MPEGPLEAGWAFAARAERGLEGVPVGGQVISAARSEAAGAWVRGLASQVWRAPEGPEGTGGLSRRGLNEAAKRRTKTKLKTAVPIVTVESAKHPSD